MKIICLSQTSGVDANWPPHYQLQLTVRLVCQYSRHPAWICVELMTISVCAATAVVSAVITRPRVRAARPFEVKRGLLKLFSAGLSAQQRGQACHLTGLG
jgi:hypothetical protein